MSRHQFKDAYNASANEKAIATQGWVQAKEAFTKPCRFSPPTYQLAAGYFQRIVVTSIRHRKQDTKFTCDHMRWVSDPNS